MAYKQGKIKIWGLSFEPSSNLLNAFFLNKTTVNSNKLMLNCTDYKTQHTLFLLIQNGNDYVSDFKYWLKAHENGIWRMFGCFRNLLFLLLYYIEMETMQYMLIINVQNSPLQEPLFLHIWKTFRNAKS